MSPSELIQLTKSTTIILNTIGPYSLHGTPVVAACADNGTHYIDLTGESPWIAEMIKKYHHVAEANHSILIPCAAIESSPPDLLVWSVVDLLRRENPQTAGQNGVGEVVSTISEFKVTASGGSQATILSMTETYGMAALEENIKWTHSPVPKRPTPLSKSNSSWFTLQGIRNNILGVRTVPELGGTITTSLFASANVAVVQRSWGLLDKGNFYGQDFDYHEYFSTRNYLMGVLGHWAIILLGFLLSSSLFRSLLKLLTTAPGEGVDKDVAGKEIYEIRTMATTAAATTITTATTKGIDGRPRRALARFRYEGSAYYLSGLLIAEAAMVLLKDEEKVKELGGGLLTPACLGQAYIDRLKKVGCTYEVGILP